MRNALKFLTVILFAMAIFFSKNSVKESSTEINLSYFITLNSADAECSGGGFTMRCNAFNRCTNFGAGHLCGF